MFLAERLCRWLLNEKDCSNSNNKTKEQWDQVPFSPITESNLYSLNFIEFLIGKRNKNTNTVTLQYWKIWNSNKAVTIFKKMSMWADLPELLKYINSLCLLEIVKTWNHFLKINVFTGSGNDPELKYNENVWKIIWSSEGNIQLYLSIKIGAVLATKIEEKLLSVAI